MANNSFARVHAGYIIDLLTRQLIRARAGILPDGLIYGGSLDMMTKQVWTTKEIIICPLHQQIDDRYDQSSHGGIVMKGRFDIYYRHRNSLDEKKGGKYWLDSYYQVQFGCLDAVNGWWPVEWDSSTGNEGKFVTIEPIHATLFNEPRQKWRDSSLGEGMVEMEIKYLATTPQFPVFSLAGALPGEAGGG